MGCAPSIVRLYGRELYKNGCIPVYGHLTARALSLTGSDSFILPPSNVPLSQQQTSSTTSHPYPLRPLATRPPKHPPLISLNYPNDYKRWRTHLLASHSIPSNLVHVSIIKREATPIFLADSVPSNPAYRRRVSVPPKIGTSTAPPRIKAYRPYATRLMLSEVPCPQSNKQNAQPRRVPVRNQGS